MTVRLRRRFVPSIAATLAGVGLALTATACVGPGAADEQADLVPAAPVAPSPQPSWSIEESVRAAKGYATYDDALAAHHRIKAAVDRDCLSGLGAVEAEAVQKTFDLDEEILTRTSGTYSTTTNFMLSFIPTVIDVCLDGVSPYAP